ncbi:MAG: EF-P lysine aminoacylase EpmA [Myxococcota bacterium]|nr:EF-P lysine aminoacylase EpmA [Myxococcota bacterium]
MSPTLSPSDLLGRAPCKARVGGRVFSCSPEGVVLADALGMIQVEARAPLELRPGELVVFSGAWTGSLLRVSRLLERLSAPEPRGGGELGRFLLNGVGQKLAARSRALSEARSYFAEQRFLEVETPLLVRAPGVDRNVEALRAASGYLITSPEHAMKRLLVGGVPRLFQLGRVFRRDESGALHEPEFTLLEWYRAFSDYRAILADTEALVSRVAKALSGRFELTSPDGRKIPVKPPFERVRVEDAFREHAGVRDVAKLAETDEDRYFELLVGRVEPALARRDRPVFLSDYPLSQAALSRPCPADPRFAERFELYVGGVELSNGYGELTDPDEQRRRFVLERKRRRAEKRSVYPLDEAFLSALAEGMPPSSGNALGFDRLVALALGASRIQDVVAFPWQGAPPR